MLNVGKNLFLLLIKKYFEKYMNNEIDVFDFLENVVNSKFFFVIEILLNS